MKAFRIFEVKDLQPLTLFHGVGGSRTLPVDEWIEADTTRCVRDGTSETWYKPGFHVIQRREDAEAYMKRFKASRDLTISEVEVAGAVWEKEHSPSPVLLVEKMRIPATAWQEALLNVYNPTVQ